MAESVEVTVARLEEQIKFLIDEAKEARSSRKSQYESIERIDKVVASMSSEISDVKGKLAGQAPTIEEFITIKHKVVGAGKLGGWLWTAGVFLIGFLAASRESIIDWISK